MEIFFLRVLIIVEGIMEVGFLWVLFKFVFDGKDMVYGIRVVDGGGNEVMFGVFEVFKDVGISVGGFCDDEVKFLGCWVKFKVVVGLKFF